MRVAAATKRDTWPSCSQVIRLTTSSWPPNCSVTATMLRLYGTLRLLKLGPPSVPRPLSEPNPAASAAISAWHWPQYLR